MSVTKIQEARNGAAQLSQGKYFLMTNKFKVKKGSNVGQALIVVRLSHLENDPKDPNLGIFVEDKSFLLSQKQFDDWLALLIQIGNIKVENIKEGAEPNGKKKF